MVTVKQRVNQIIIKRIKLSLDQKARPPLLFEKQEGVVEINEKLKSVRNILGGVWAFSIIIRVVGKLTDWYTSPSWFSYIIFATIIIYIILSIYIHFKKD